MKKVYLFLLVGVLVICLLVGGYGLFKSKSVKTGRADFGLWGGEIGTNTIPSQFDMCAAGDTPTNLIHYWAFEENSGNQVYDSVGNNHGTIEGTVVHSGNYYTGSGLVLGLDGNKNWVDINDVKLNGSFTIEFWSALEGQLSNDQINNKDAIVGQQGPGADINFYAGKLRIYGPGDKIVANTPAVDQVWTHWAITREANGWATDIKLYRNGKLDSSSSKYWGGDFKFTAIGRGNAGFLKGMIDDLAVYSSALTGAEIFKHYMNSAIGLGYCKENTNQFGVGLPEGVQYDDDPFEGGAKTLPIDDTDGDGESGGDGSSGPRS